ncbi:MAG: 30S ribosome-binding factor RbfA [Candidatus Omnitrophica bacterium]|nr:30S ribosome-binding factor RbfA [Candidatus Omnitrophota bacterium]
MPRADKVGKELQKTISTILADEISDPRLGFITVTYVGLTSDLRYARVFWSFLGDPSQQKAAEKGLESARGFVRKLVGQRVRLKYVPEIVFIHDDGPERVERIAQALKLSDPDAPPDEDQE